MLLSFYHFLSHLLIARAEVFFRSRAILKARACNAEGLQYAEDIGNKSQIFAGRAQKAKIDFALGHKEKAVELLINMLIETANEDEMAELHFELWKMNQTFGGFSRLSDSKDNHHTVALKLYNKLYAKTPNIEYKNRIDELTSMRNEE